MKRTLILASAVLLLGCAGQPEWSRQGVSAHQTAAEIADCQSQARQATQRDTNIMSDIMATRGTDWQQSGTMGTHMDLFSAENQKRTSGIVDQCMIGKGFVPGGD